MTRTTHVATACALIVIAVLSGPVRGSTASLNHPADNANVRTDGSWFQPDGATDIDTSEADRIDVEIFIFYDSELIPDKHVVRDVDIENYNWEVLNPPGLVDIASDEPAINGSWEVFLYVDNTGVESHDGNLIENWL